MKIKINNQEIELTDEQVAKLREVLSEEKESDWFEPKRGEKHWYLNGSGVYGHPLGNRDNYETHMALRQRLYRTKEEALQADRLRIAETAVNKYIIQNFGEFKPDWSNHEQEKWFIRYDYSIKEYDAFFSKTDQFISKILPLISLQQVKKVLRDCKEHLDVIFGIK